MRKGDGSQNLKLFKDHFKARKRYAGTICRKRTDFKEGCTAATRKDSLFCNNSFKKGRQEA